MRAQVLKAQPLCEMCGREVAREVDHITPLARGGTHHRENLRAVCVGCHKAKTASDASDARKEAR